MDIAIESGHSRIPVYHEDIDNIVGILYVKDLLKYVCEEVPENFKITDLTRTVPCVPRSKNLSRLFAEMTKKKIQLAIVVDEYGGTEGIISIEDLVEDIMGNIQDEYDDEDERTDLPENYLRPHQLRLGNAVCLTRADNVYHLIQVIKRNQQTL